MKTPRKDLGVKSTSKWRAFATSNQKTIKTRAQLRKGSCETPSASCPLPGCGLGSQGM